MTDSRLSARPSSHRSSSALAPAAQASDSSSIRPRNRRLISTLDDGDDDNSANRDAGAGVGAGLLAAFSAATTIRTASPYRSDRSGVSPNRPGNIGAFLNDSWTQGWASVQGLASSLLTADESQPRAARSQSTTRGGSGPGTWGRNFSSSSTSRKGLGNWGPAPPAKKPELADVAAGSLEERETALKAARTASVLESHAGVNGGLDVTGRHKRRNSDEAILEQPESEEYLVYIHKVRPNDTYAGLILRYQCREDAFRKANGLWSRDSVHLRKYLTIPVDACGIRGRPCEPPSYHNSHNVDLLAPTPAEDDASSTSQAVHDDFFTRPANGSTGGSKVADEEDCPWTHVRWVKIDSFQDPIEIGRVSRRAMGYFPPRRKKSIRTFSTFSTPRQSFDLASNPPGSTEGSSSRRPSALGNRPRVSSTTMSSPGRIAPEGPETLPSWMRRPGGVGSMGRNVRSPGPDKDVLSTWTKKHLPGLNIEGMPSMSITGSETARFGFKPESAELVDTPFAEGRDTTYVTPQGNGLDKAAAAVETWLRGALARHPSASLVGNRGKPRTEGDLIELIDTGSDDGKMTGGPPTHLLDSLNLGSSGQSYGEAAVRGRTMTTGAKGKKSD